MASVFTYTVSTLPASDSLDATAAFVTMLSSISDSACVSTAAVSSVTVFAPHATDIIASIAAIITENDFIKLFLIMTNFSSFIFYIEVLLSANEVLLSAKASPEHVRTRLEKNLAKSSQLKPHDG